MITEKKNSVNSEILYESSKKKNKNYYDSSKKKLLLLKKINLNNEDNTPIKVHLIRQKQKNGNKIELIKNLDYNKKNIDNNNSNKKRLFSSFLLKKSYSNMNSKTNYSSSLLKINHNDRYNNISDENNNNVEEKKKEINRLKELLTKSNDTKTNNNIFSNVKRYETEINENTKNKNIDNIKIISKSNNNMNNKKRNIINLDINYNKNINKGKIYNLIYKKNIAKEKEEKDIIKDNNINDKNNAKSEQKDKNTNKHKIRNILSKNFAFSKFKTLDLLKNNKRYSNKSPESISYVNTINDYVNLKKEKNENKNENEIKSLKSNYSKDTIKKTSSINTNTTTSNITEIKNVRNNILNFNNILLNSDIKINKRNNEKNNFILDIKDNKSVELKNKLNKLNKFKCINEIENVNVIKNNSDINNKNKKIEIKFDELILYEEKLNDIFIAINSFNNMENATMHSECADFFQFYSNSSLNNKLSNFFLEDNYIIIQSSLNLELFIIMLIYHFSFYNKILADSIILLIDIFSKLKLNFNLLVKQILIYYNNIQFFENEKNRRNLNIIINILKNSKISNINILEDEIIEIINDNCTNISNNVHKLLNIYLQNEKNNININYDDLMSIFNQLSIISEIDIINYFYKNIYKEDTHKEKDKSNKKKISNIFLNYKQFNHKRKYRNNINSPYKQNNTENLYQNKNRNSFMKDINNNINGNNNNNNSNIIEHNKNEKIMNNNNYISVFHIKNKNNINNNINSNNIINNSNNNINNNYYMNSPNIIPPFIKVPRQKNKKYTLILDLDETLVHVKQINTSTNNIYLNTYNNFSNQKIINLRPGLFAFLNGVKPYYEIISFSCASKTYADNILYKIETNQKYFEYNLYREHTTLYENEYIKDLSKIGRNIKEMIIVDNLEKNFRLNPDNGIKISSYFGEINTKEDNKLYELLKLLILFYKLKYKDLRMAIKDYKQFILDKISFE